MGKAAKGEEDWGIDVFFNGEVIRTNALRRALPF
jgi:hypothetical protein